MAGALLHRGISVLKACPRITDVFYMEEILRALGAETWWEDHDLYLDCTHADGSHVPETYSGRMRSSIILLGPLLVRNGRAEIGYPGGCVIGKRPVDLHLYVLKSFGAEIKEEEKKITVSCKKLCGTEIVFSKRSVGATEQAILCATLVGIPAGVTHLPSSFIALPHSLTPVFAQVDIIGALNIAFLPYLFVFFASEFFSTMGTTLAVGGEAGLLDEEGNMPHINRPFMVDSIAAALGPWVGIPAATALRESSASAEAGGKTDAAEEDRHKYAL